MEKTLSLAEQLISRRSVTPEDGRDRTAVPVYTSAPDDIAVLRVTGLSARPLALGRELPPRRLGPALHVPDSGDEGIEQARIVTLAGDSAEVVVHRIRITAQQVVWRRDPQVPLRVAR